MELRYRAKRCSNNAAHLVANAMRLDASWDACWDMHRVKSHEALLLYEPQRARKDAPAPPKSTYRRERGPCGGGGSAGRLAVAYLDVDYFRRLNRTTLHFARTGKKLVDPTDAVDRAEKLKALHKEAMEKFGRREQELDKLVRTNVWSE
jgi:hypothetical protein